MRKNYNLYNNFLTQYEFQKFEILFWNLYYLRYYLGQDLFEW